MTKLQTVLLAIACFILAGLAYGFVPKAELAAAGLLALGTYLGGTARLHPSDKAKLTEAERSSSDPRDSLSEEQPKAKGPDMKNIATVLVIFAALSITACKTTPNTPDSFFGAVVTCTRENSHNAQAGQAVLNCLMNAAGGNYGACLSGLVAAGYWTVDEIACVVRQYATESAQRINSGEPTPSDSIILERANQWLRDKQVRFQ